MKLCEHLMKKIVVFCLLVGVVLLSGALPVAAANVNIPDANLRKAINRALGRPATAAVTEAQMKTLTTLEAPGHTGRAWAPIRDLTGLEKATNLTSLDLGANAISNISALSGLTNLTTLKLGMNITAPVGPGGSFPYLSSGSGSPAFSNSVSDLTPLSRLTKLTTLDLRLNAVRDISALSGLTKLTTLYLGNYGLDISAWEQDALSERYDPATFNVISNISALSGLTKLTTLDLTQCGSFTDMSALSRLTKLTHLYLGKNGTFSDISALSGLTNLKMLDLRQTYYVSDISPLVSNTGLGTGDKVALGNGIAVVGDGPWQWGGLPVARIVGILENQYRSESLSYPSIYTHIPALQTRGVTVSFTNRVPTTLTKVSGDAQTGVTSTALANPFVVEVKDGTTRSVWDSNTRTNTRVPAPVAFEGVPVTFAVTGGGGTLSATTVATDATGRAQVTLTPGATAATQTVTATVTHAGRTLTQTFTATANRLPTFTSADTFSVAEHTPAATTVGTVVATDADSQDSVTYAITGGADSAKFAITNAGVLTFAAAPNYEAPGDLVSTDPANAAGNNQYVIVVTATSGSGARQLTATQPLTITVTDVNEPPGKPGTPTVTAAATTPTSLNVSWTAPQNAGKPAITAYNLQYRKNNEANWTAATYAGTATNTTLTGLTPGTPYDVQVLAKNHEGDSPWSNSGRATTSTNAAPTFTSAATFSVAENATAVGTVVATDADSADNVTGYAITGGADSSKFAITNAGELTFAAAPNYETPGDLGSTTPANDAGDNQYVLVVTATSGTAARVQSATQTLTITVTDVNEPPAKPDAPTVTAPTATPTRINVSWTAPRNTGPAITAYNLQYRKNGETSWTQAGYAGTDTRTTLTGLTVGTSYEVRVRAKNAEGDGPWSNSIGAATATDAPPTFTSPATFSVAENTTAVGSIIATDANRGYNVITPSTTPDSADRGDSVISYTITGGADRAKFAVTLDSGPQPGGPVLDSVTLGRLTFNAAPNYEAPGDLVSTDPANAAGNNEYVIVVTVTSGRGTRVQTATQTLTITVTDVDEAPAQPAAPTVTAAAATPTQLSVNWTAPSNGGPAITDYDVRYRADVTAPNGDFTDAHYNGTTTSTTLTDLKPSTSYQVQVRARSDEGIGPWSDAGTAKTAVQPEDVDNDGDVDINDLLAVISNFGSASPGRNDVDSDGDVDADDIRRVFNELLTAERAAAAAPAQAARRITHTAEALHHYVQQTKQNGMLDGHLHRGLRVLEELIEPFLMPDETALLRNYPNPFNPETWLPYQLSKPADVTFAIYSVNGTLVRTLSLGYQAAGVYRHRSRAAYWDGRNALGESVASGVYFYTLTAGDFIATGKMLIRK